jgi:hypothetical protein
MTAIASDYWQNWPTHCRHKMLPLPHGGVDSFWDEAWAQIQVEPNALILSTNEWTLAELRTAATRAAFRTGQPLVLPTMKTVEQWCDAAIAPDGVRVSSYARTLTIDAALAEAPTQLLGAISGVTRRALASTLAQLIDALDIAQFPTSDAAQALLEATTNQPFAQRELAIAQAIAAALADVPGITQQRLARFAEKRSTYAFDPIGFG